MLSTASVIAFFRIVEKMNWLFNMALYEALILVDAVGFKKVSVFER